MLLRQFQSIVKAEGWTYILLLLAMPIKYLLGKPGPVMILGWSHGILFVMYITWHVRCWYTYKWKFSKAFFYGILSLVPLASFWLSKQLQKEREM